MSPCRAINRLHPGWHNSTIESQNSNAALLVPVYDSQTVQIEGNRVPPLYRMKKRDVTTTSAAVSPQMRHNWLRPSFDLTMSCTIMLSVTSPQSQLNSTRSVLDPIP